MRRSTASSKVRSHPPDRAPGPNKIAFPEQWDKGVLYGTVDRHAVAIGDFLFGPEKLEVPRGTYVSWTNTDDSPHQVTVTSAGGLRTEVIQRGQKAFLKFDSPGTYD